MKIIAGLGNPGKQYDKTPHNIGFMVLDVLGDSFKDSSKLQSLIEKTEISETPVLLIKPQTFMNLSGEAVIKVMNFYKKNHEDLIVLHDDSDLEFGKIKISKNQSSAGHKGINSIEQHLHTLDFTRFRIGIRPEGNTRKAETFVLQTYNQNELPKVEKLANNIASAIAFYLENGLTETMNKFHNIHLAE